MLDAAPRAQVLSVAFTSIEEAFVMGMRCELFAASAADIERLATEPDSFEQIVQGSGLHLEKSWHGLHYVLTGTSWGGEFPHSLLLLGGTEIEDADMGYGPARALSPDEVITASNALEAIDDAEFDRRFDLDALAAAEVYPGIWDETREELLEEYLMYFHQLQQFLRQAARQRMGAVVFVG